MSLTQTREINITVDNQKITLITDQDTFSYRRLDPGTKVFLKDLPSVGEIEGNLLDIGCGYGPITVTLALKYPQRVIYAVDVNQKAIYYLQENLKRYSIKNVKVFAPEEFPKNIEFAYIYSNPPIRIGKKNLYALCEKWLQNLKQDGKAFLLVKRNLGADSLAEHLESIGYKTERLFSKNGYRVLGVGG